MKLYILITSLFLFSHSAIASVILQPVSAKTNVDNLRPISQTIDQSGLSIGYNNLTDNFDSYISSNPTSYHGYGDNVWGTTEGIRSAQIIYNLGGTYKVDKIALWNLVNDDESAMKNFTVIVDDNPSFSTPIEVGSYIALNTLGTDPDAASQIFSFDSTSASYIMLSINNTWSPNSYGLAFNEIAFSVTPVPLPPTLLLFLSGLISLFSINSMYNKSSKPTTKSVPA